MSYQFILSDGKMANGSTWFDQKRFDSKKVEIRYLSFHPEWSAATGGSRLFDLFKHFMICVTGLMALALIRLFLGFFKEGPPGS